MAAIRMDGKALAAKVKEQIPAGGGGTGPAARAGGDPRGRRPRLPGVCEQQAERLRGVRYLQRGVRPAGRRTSQEELLGLIGRAQRHGRTSTASWSSCPCPRSLNEKEVLLAIDPGKDVDCFHPYQRGHS